MCANHLVKSSYPPSSHQYQENSIWTWHAKSTNISMWRSSYLHWISISWQFRPHQPNNCKIYYCNFILSYNLGTVQALVLHITAREAKTSTGARGRTYIERRRVNFSIVSNFWFRENVERSSLGFQSWWSSVAPNHSTSSWLSYRTVVTCSNRCTLAPRPPSRLSQARLRRRGDVADIDDCVDTSTTTRWSLRPHLPCALTSSLRTNGTAPSVHTSASETEKFITLFSWQAHESDPSFICSLLSTISGELIARAQLIVTWR